MFILILSVRLFYRLVIKDMWRNHENHRDYVRYIKDNPPPKHWTIKEYEEWLNQNPFFIPWSNK
jgi:hypothetical protein